MTQKKVTATGTDWKALVADDADLMRAVVRQVMQEVLEAEMTEMIGAGPGERTDTRQGYRAGYYPRTLVTRVGKLELRVPRDREGRFSTELFERYQRSEKALVSALAEMYVQGVSTRKVAAITEELCGRAFSSQQVSKLAKGLDEKVDEWRNRPIEGEHPYLVVDARYEKVRRGGRVISQGVLIAMGISSQGMREILSVVIADTENETTWSDLFRDLRGRGLSGVELVTSDNHEGIKKAAMRHFQGASWQRCQCHFIKNLLDLAGKGQKADLHADLRAIFDSCDIETLNRLMDETIHKWSEKKPAVAKKIDEEIVDALACFCFPPSHRKRIRTTNALERLRRGDKEEDPGSEDLPQRGLSLEAHRYACHGAV